MKKDYTLEIYQELPHEKYEPVNRNHVAIVRLTQEQVLRILASAVEIKQFEEKL